MTRAVTERMLDEMTKLAASGLHARLVPPPDRETRMTTDAHPYACALTSAGGA